MVNLNSFTLNITCIYCTLFEKQVLTTLELKKMFALKAFSPAKIFVNADFKLFNCYLGDDDVCDTCCIGYVLTLIVPF